MKRLTKAFAIGLVLFLFVQSYVAANPVIEEKGRYSLVDTKKLEPSLPQRQKEERQISGLYAKEALLMDGDTGRVLYEKDGYKRHAMASTTKIMTAIYIMENCDLEETALVSQHAASQPKVHLGVQPGEQYKVKDLLYALMLESFNDCAVVLAEHVGGSVPKFCAAMTKKAQEMGCKDTSFETPNGLDGENHYTTPYDLARITRYALKNPTFCKIIKTKEYSFSEIHGKRNATVYNKDGFLNQYPGAIGVKTGFTNKAGYCFVGAIRHEGKYLISVVLASGWPPNKSYKWKDTIAMMEYGESNYEKVKVIGQKKRVGQIEVDRGKERALPILLEDGKKLLLSPKDKVEAHLDLRKEIEAPVKKGQKVGTLSIYVNDVCYDTIAIRTAKAMERERADACFYRLARTYACLQ